MQTRKQKFILLFVLLLGCFATSILWPKGEDAVQPTRNGVIDVNSMNSNGSSENKGASFKRKRAKLQIYVSGAVMNPGMYQMEDGARAQDAIEAAGGLREDANLERVNLARKLKDGYQVNVPAVRGNNSSNSGSRNTIKSAYGNRSTNSANMHASGSLYENGTNANYGHGNASVAGGYGAQAGAFSSVGTSDSSQQIVNVNTASESELQHLPGVGPAMAQRIIDERTKRPFATVDDLKRVRGIGDAKLAKMRAKVRV